MDAHKNLAISAVATAPSPAISGTSLVVAAGEGARFPAVPFNATVWPAGELPDPSNAEIVRVTAVASDTLTITRAQEGSTARTIAAGDLIAATITAKTLDDVKSAISAASPGEANPWSPSSLDDEFNAGSLDPKWTWRNQGTASVSFPSDVAGGGLKLTAPPAGALSHRMLGQPIGSTFDIRTRVSFYPGVGGNGALTNFRMAGLRVWNNTSGKGAAFEIFTYSAGPSRSIQMRIMSGDTAEASAKTEQNSLPGGLTIASIHWLRLVSDGTTLTAYVSVDGVYWFTLSNFTETIASFIGSIDRAGIFVDNRAGSGDCFAIFHWFRSV